MISFDRVNKPNTGYSITYPYVQFVHNAIYYRQFEVIGKENLPPKGEGYLAICNHQNGLNDALGVLYAIGGKRRPVFIARGDLFKKENSLARILRFFRIMPAFRVRDDGWGGLGQNEAIFEQSARIIEEGDVVALFPEATHQHGHFLAQFKKGFARIAFKVAEKNHFEEPIRILPLAHHYSNYFSMQTKLVMVVGEPFDFTELYDIYREDPNRAITLLNEKARKKVQELMLDIKDKEHYEEWELMCRMYQEQYMSDHQMDKHSVANELRAQKAINAKLEEFQASAPEQFGELLDKASRYNANLKTLRLRDWIFRRKLSTGFWTRLVVALVLFPFWLYGLVVNCLPIAICNFLTGSKMKDRFLHASVQILINAFLLPVWYLLLFALAWILSGNGWIALASLVTFYLGLVLYARFNIFYIKLFHRTRRFILKARHEPHFFEGEKLHYEIIADIKEKVMSE